MPGLTDFLTWIDRRGLQKAAVTNAPKDNTMLMLKALKLDTYFEVVVLGEECARAKPHPDPYQQALQLLGLQPHEAIVIEDSPSGKWHQQQQSAARNGVQPWVGACMRLKTWRHRNSDNGDKPKLQLGLTIFTGQLDLTNSMCMSKFCVSVR